MVKRRTFKKSVNAAVKKAIAKYYRVTCSKIITLIGGTNGVALGGDTSYPLSDILTGQSTFQELGKQFALVKLRGIYIEVCPCAMTEHSGMLCLALQQANEPGNTNAYSQPNVIPVSEVQNTKKYIRIGSQWMPTNDSGTFANLKLVFQALQTFTGDKHWNVLIKLYLTFKSSI